jgi:hypothetical protein
VGSINGQTLGHGIPNSIFQNKTEIDKLKDRQQIVKKMIQQTHRWMR